MTPCRAVHHDPEIYNDPSTFDGFRFYDATTNPCTPKVFTSSATFLTFSHGSGTCPARILAAQIARMVFAKILETYEIVLAHEEMPEWSRMGPSGAIYFPNPDVNMRVKRRVEGEGGGDVGVDGGINKFI
jgi:cytochrome P450